MAGDSTPDEAIPQILTVRSSAGSGKTYRLAEHYLKVLLASALADATLQTRMANIVAITFTNKAAREMRARIIDWMKRIILDLPFDNSPVKPLDTIMMGITTVLPVPDADCPSAAGPQDAERAKKVRDYLMTATDRLFAELLKDFGHFNVGTIDSFVNLTLKASAMQLNLPPDFEVSTETNELIDLALRECLQKTGEDARARETFDTFLTSYIELEGDHTSWIPRELLKTTISSLWTEEAKENREFSIPAGGTRGGGASLRKNIAEKARCLLESLEADKNIQPLTRALKAIEKCADLQEDPLSSSVYFERSLDECLKKTSAPPCAPDVLVWNTLTELRRMYAEVMAASKFLPYLEVYSFFKEVFQREITYYRRIIPIEELNRLLQDIVSRKDFIPEVYYTLSERYVHFLIDEFQDTSRLQWKNIEVLAEEALSRGGTLFLVGDRKQAIYRWRGGRPELVDEVALKYEEQYPAGRLVLDTNYRSGEHVVAFNNEVFNEKHLIGLVHSILGEHPRESQEGVIAPYRDATQHFLDTRKGQGYVFVEQLTLEGDDDDRQEVFARDEANEIVEERLRDLVAQIMARGVFREDDIAVLVRTRQEAKAVVRVLLSMNLSVESEYTVSIRNNPLVREVICFLTFIDKPDDDLSFASFITGRIFGAHCGIDASEMGTWLARKRLSKNAGFLYLEFKSDFRTIFDDEFAGFLARAGYLPLYDLVVSFFKHWEVLARFSDHAPYLLHFLELVKERETADNNTITGFIDFAGDTFQGSSYGNSDEDKAFLLPTPDSLNAIKVLTIHKAKGLQFPVVILPFVTLTTFGSSAGRDKQRCFQSGSDGLKLLYLKKDYVEASPELAALYRTKECEYLADELNNLYVAFTRAEDELYIFLADKKRQRNHLIDHLFGMEELRPFVNDTRIVLGRAKAGKTGEDGGAAGAASGAGAIFGDFRGEPQWAVKIRTGVSDAGKLSRHTVRARKKGDAIHRALSFIGTLPIDDDLIGSFARAAAAEERIADASEEIEHALRDFLANPRFRRFFETAPNVVFHNEKEIVDGEGNTFKMDRMV
ncbi:MAG: UvrD-helicase domain-containing protein, partial [Syntrophorhabdaceae bacterium]|nr:UvrD-helicase domain-containing protein [Syntrophorhabdaceae bacterium]